jgi:hypothetical protein
MVKADCHLSFHFVFALHGGKAFEAVLIGVPKREPSLESSATKRRYTSFSETYRRFVVSSPFHGLRVVLYKPT